MKNKEEIDAFIKDFKGSREELNKVLKARFNVQLLRPGKYIPHTGLKQRVRNLVRTGLTREEALEKLCELE